MGSFMENYKVNPQKLNKISKISNSLDSMLHNKKKNERRYCMKHLQTYLHSKSSHSSYKVKVANIIIG